MSYDIQEKLVREFRDKQDKALGTHQVPSLALIRLVAKLAQNSENVIYDSLNWRVYLYGDRQKGRGFCFEYIPIDNVSRVARMTGAKEWELRLYQLPMPLPHEHLWSNWHVCKAIVKLTKPANCGVVVNKHISNRIQDWCVNRAILFGYVSVKFVN